MAVHAGLAVIDEGTAISKEVVSEDKTPWMMSKHT